MGPNRPIYWRRPNGKTIGIYNKMPSLGGAPYLSIALPGTKMSSNTPERKKMTIA